MTEQEWLTATDPRPMLKFLLGDCHPRVMDVESFPDCKAGDRPLRLFACACYARVRHLLPDPRARAGIEVAERFVEGQATAAELHAVHDRLQGLLNEFEMIPWRAARGADRIALQPTYSALALALQVTRPLAPKAAYYASSNAYLDAAAIMNPGARPSDRSYGETRGAEERAQADLIRCIRGNPFRPLAIEPAWLTPAVLGLARLIYDDRRFDLMPVLGAALSDAGCKDEMVLRHCVAETPHVRGCHVIDLLLNRA